MDIFSNTLFGTVVYFITITQDYGLFCRKPLW